MKSNKKLLYFFIASVFLILVVPAVVMLWMWRSDKWIFKGEQRASEHDEQSEVDQDESDLDLEEVEDEEDEIEEDVIPPVSDDTEVDSTPPSAPPAAPPAANFSDNGVLLSGAGGWTILYEEPGKPALNANLMFDSNSQCDTGGGLGTCNTAAFTHGTDIDVIGYLSGNNLTVYELVYR